MLERPGIALTTAFFFDDCHDGSRDAARALTTDFPFAVTLVDGGPAPIPSAGRARRAAMTIGLDASGAVPHAVLLSTDADSRPRPDWLCAALNALDHADMAAGRIVRIDSHLDPAQTQVEAYFDRLYAIRRTLDPVAWDTREGCHYSGAANLAFRADAYRALGGFPAIATAEDARLLDDAARAGMRVRHEPAMIVDTSSRRIGRVHGGLATALGDFANGSVPMVGQPAAAIWQYRRHAQARGAFARLDDALVRHALAQSIGSTADHVLGVGRDCPNAEAFAMRIVPAAPGHDQSVPLAQAMAALAAFEEDCYRPSA